MPVRSAEAQWEGGIKSGGGAVRTESGILDSQYNFSGRFEEGSGTNPEELIAAAEAACYSMALSGNLEGAGFEAESIRTTAECHVVPKDGGGFVINRIDVRTEVKAGDISDEQFQQIAQQTKDTCPVSVVLSAAEITLEAKLAG